MLVELLEAITGNVPQTQGGLSVFEMIDPDNKRVKKEDFPLAPKNGSEDSVEVKVDPGGEKAELKIVKDGIAESVPLNIKQSQDGNISVEINGTGDSATMEVVGKIAAQYQDKINQNRSPSSSPSSPDSSGALQGSTMGHALGSLVMAFTLSAQFILSIID